MLSNDASSDFVRRGHLRRCKSDPIFGVKTSTDSSEALSGEYTEISGSFYSNDLPIGDFGVEGRGRGGFRGRYNQRFVGSVHGNGRGEYRNASGCGRDFRDVHDSLTLQIAIGGRGDEAASKSQGSDSDDFLPRDSGDRDDFANGVHVRGRGERHRYAASPTRRFGDEHDYVSSPGFAGYTRDTGGSGPGEVAAHSCNIPTRDFQEGEESSHDSEYNNNSAISVLGLGRGGNYAGIEPFSGEPEPQGIVITGFPRRMMRPSFERVRIAYEISKTVQFRYHYNHIIEEIRVEDKDKLSRFVEVMKANPEHQTLVLVSRNRTADIMACLLCRVGIPATSINNDHEQYKNEHSFASFRHGTCMALVATHDSIRKFYTSNKQTSERRVDHILFYDLPQGYMASGICRLAQLKVTYFFSISEPYVRGTDASESWLSYFRLARSKDVFVHRLIKMVSFHDNSGY